MKSFACHRLYETADKYLGQSVVTVNDNGEVVSFSSLDSEVRHTTWIGGVIILSSLREFVRRDDFTDTLHALTGEGGCPLYAWHVSDFDFLNDAFTAQSILSLLH